MNYYTNVAVHGKNILLRGFENGKRIAKTISYKPYLFVPARKETPYKTLNDSFVEKMQFNTIYEAKEFLDKYQNVDGFNIYGMDRWAYTYIHDHYPGTIEFDPSKINVVGIDIEVDTEDGYPIIEKADKKITAITMRRRNQKVVFGYGDYTPPDKSIIYIKCRDEVYLLSKFLMLWNEYDPDVVTGWNIDGFDIPYLVVRIQNILGEKEANRLSPWNILRERKIFVRGKEVTIYNPVGVSVLDYQMLYKKFTANQASSYSLNNICYVELKEKKLDYSEYSTLDQLYKRNHQLFVEYNIRDVDLIFKLEESLGYINLVLTMAYDAKVNFNDTFTSVLLWDVIIYNYLADKNIVIPQYRKKEKRELEGGFCKDITPGMYEWVMSFDLTSLYPHLIIQYNISPETFHSKIEGVNVEHCLHFGGQSGPHAMTANGCFYRKDKFGFLPTLMEHQFAQRKHFQHLMREAEKAGNKNDVSKYDKAQYNKKIQLNSLYGTLGNEGCRYFEINHAEAITMSGQLSIRYMADRVNEYMNNICNTEGVDYIVAIDTDSLYITFKEYVYQQFPVIENKNDVVSFLDNLAVNTIEPLMNEQYGILANKMGAYKQAMKMKREIIADKAIWTAKKRYMANMWDKERQRYNTPKLKIMGIETARSSTPEVCRNALEEAISILMNKDETTLQSYIADFKEQYFKLPFEDVASPRGVQNIEKWLDSATLYKKGTPIHVKGSIQYNRLLKERNMKDIPIFEGDKIKFVYLKLPNPVGDTIIAAHNFMPFDDVTKYIDYHLQFEKTFLGPLNHILSTIGWTHKEEESLKGLFA